ncbi:MAG: hypothetical protein ACLQPD_25205 [Desulfomonilaceae bacterium]
MKTSTYRALMVPVLAVMMTVALTVGPAAAQQYRPFQMYDNNNMWAAPAQAGSTGQEALTGLEHTGIPPFNFGNVASSQSSSFYYDGNMRFFRDRWSGGGPGVRGDSGLSVMHQFP